jgi:hypothetical protein
MLCVAAGVTVGVAQLAGQSPARPDVTFARDILPILQTSCQDCHRPGGSGPMPLVTYDDVRPCVASLLASSLTHAGLDIAVRDVRSRAWWCSCRA